MSKKGRAFVIFYGFAVGAVLIFTLIRGERTRETTNEIKTIVTKPGPCTLDPKGNECQSTLQDAVKAFDRETSCILARKIGFPCSRKKGSPDSSPGGQHEPAPRPTPSDGTTTVPQPSGPAPVVGGNPGDGAGGSAQPPPSPPHPPSPPTPDPHPPAPAQPSGLQGIAEGVGETVGATCQTVNGAGLPVHVPC
jgi:hypothetical protein